MDKESTTHGLSAEKLRQIWDIGSDVDQDNAEIEPDLKRAELLRDWLTCTLPPDKELADLLPALLMRLFRELRPFAGESFASLLQDPQTDISLIAKIKDLSKKLVESAKSAAERDAAAAIYYSAIASALVFHDRKITSFSYERLAQSFSSLSDKRWLTPETGQLIDSACKLSRKRIKTRKGRLKHEPNAG